MLPWLNHLLIFSMGFLQTEEAQVMRFRVAELHLHPFYTASLSNFQSLHYSFRCSHILCPSPHLRCTDFCHCNSQRALTCTSSRIHSLWPPWKKILPDLDEGHNFSFCGKLCYIWLNVLTLRLEEENWKFVPILLDDMKDLITPMLSLLLKNN